MSFDPLAIALTVEGRVLKTGKAPMTSYSKPSRWLLKLLAALQPARSVPRRLGATLGLFALLAAFALIGYGVPALITAYNGP